MQETVAQYVAKTANWLHSECGRFQPGGCGPWLRTLSWLRERLNRAHPIGRGIVLALLLIRRGEEHYLTP
jgi:hypothetical protein